MKTTASFGLTILRIVLGLVVSAYSVGLILVQLRDGSHHTLVSLGAAELGAGILFLIPRTARFGGFAVIAVFAVAALFHIHHGEYRIGDLVVYSAAAFAVVSARTRV